MRLLLLACCLCLARGAVVVSVQSQSQEAMAALTAIIDAESQHNPNRMVLGTIEATMSRVVDSESLYPEEKIRSTPVMSRLTNMRYNNGTQAWEVQYESMRHDPTSIVNTFGRILYFSRKDVELRAGDTGNPVLQPELAQAEQLARLGSQYVVSAGASFGGDYIDSEGGAQGVTTRSVATPNSLRQSIAISIPHEYLIGALATRSLEYYNAEYGNTTTWSFGIGMAFSSANGMNMVMFDKFHLYEKNVAFYHVQAETKYSLAKHVEFYALDVGETIKVVVFYFTLDDEKRLGGQVYTSVNGVALEQGACASMQALIDALPEPSCLVSFPLCQPQVSLVNGIQAVSYAIPAPLTGEISTNIILNVTDTNPAHEQELITSLNFKLSTSSSVCLGGVATLHDPMQWAQVDVHTTSATGFMGPARTLAGTGAYGTLLTETSDVHSAEVMSQALFTLVVRAKDAAQAQQYFDGTTQVLQLDDVLMSHAIGESPGLPAAPSRVAPDEHNNFRSRIEFTGGATCPFETPVASPAAKCLTTRDWDSTGAVLRPQSANTNNFFVHEVLGTNGAESLAFLGRVFGSDGTTDLATAAVARYYAATQLLLAKPHARVYLVWPVYNWAHSPIGLIDRTMISFSWSITSQPAASARRLLGSWARESNPPPGALVLSRMDPLGRFSQLAAPPVVRRAPAPNASHTQHMERKELAALLAVRRAQVPNASHTHHMERKQLAALPAVRRVPLPNSSHTALHHMERKQLAALPAVRRMPVPNSSHTDWRQVPAPDAAHTAARRVPAPDASDAAARRVPAPNASHTALHHVASKQVVALAGVRRGAKRQANASTPMLPDVRRMASTHTNSTTREALHPRFLVPGRPR